MGAKNRPAYYSPDNKRPTQSAQWDVGGSGICSFKMDEDCPVFAGAAGRGQVPCSPCKPIWAYVRGFWWEHMQAPALYRHRQSQIPGEEEGLVLGTTQSPRQAQNGCHGKSQWKPGLGVRGLIFQNRLRFQGRRRGNHTRRRRCLISKASGIGLLPGFLLGAVGSFRFPKTSKGRKIKALSSLGRFLSPKWSLVG